jgi:tetratricopeptide (TPR) repeat protein
VKKMRNVMKASYTRITFLVLGCSLLATPAFSTIPDSLKQRIDSLRAVASSSSGLERYQAEFQIAYDLFDIDNSVAVNHAQFAYEVAQGETDTAKIVKSGRLYGQLLRRVACLDEAIEVFQEVLPLSEGLEDNVEEGRILNAMALTFTLQAVFDKALIYHYRHLYTLQAGRDSGRMGVSFTNIGFIYYLMGNHREAISFFEMAIKVGNPSAVSNATINLALAKLYLNDLASFPDLARRGLALASRDELLPTLRTYEFGFGYYYQKCGVLDSADYHYRKSLSMSRESHDDRGIAECEIRLAQCAQLRGDLNMAISKLLDVESRLSRFKYHNVRMQCYELLSYAFEQKGRWKESLRYKGMQLDLYDSLYSQNIINNMSVARVEFEESQNRLMIQKQAEIIELRESEIVQQRLLITAAVAIAGLLVGFVFLLIRSALREKRTSAQLDRKVFERTRELQISENALLRSLTEQKTLMDLVSRKIKASIASFRGLWHANQVEPIDSKIVSEKFEATATELLQLLRIIDRSIDLRHTSENEVGTIQFVQHNRND